MLGGCTTALHMVVGHDACCLSPLVAHRCMAGGALIFIWYSLLEREGVRVRSSRPPLHCTDGGTRCMLPHQAQRGGLWFTEQREEIRPFHQSPVMVGCPSSSHALIGRAGVVYATWWWLQKTHRWRPPPTTAACHGFTSLESLRAGTPPPPRVGLSRVGSVSFAGLPAATSWRAGCR